MKVNPASQGGNADTIKTPQVISRRDGRVAEGGGLLNRYRVKSSIGGSNPPLSARYFLLSTTCIKVGKCYIRTLVNWDRLAAPTRYKISAVIANDLASLRRSSSSFQFDINYDSLMFWFWSQHLVSYPFLQFARVR
jgi:hypothetical protein